MTNEERTTKPDIASPPARSFVIRIWTFLRHSSFALRHSAALDLLFLSLLAAFVLLLFLGQNYHWASREIRHAEIMREMNEDGDFLIPHLMGQIYVDKPPVLHALGAAFMRVGGRANIFFARLPAALAGIMAVLSLYGLGRLLGSRNEALLGSLTLLAMPGFVIMGRVARPDMILVTLILLSCLGLGWAMRNEIKGPSRAGLLILAGLTSGLAVITKGPYGVMFPLFFLALAPLRQRELKRPRWGMLLFGLSLSVIIGAWVLAVYLRDGGKYLHDVLHQPDLTTNDIARKGFFWYAAPLLVHTLPVSLFLPLTVGKWRREGFSPSLGIATVILLVLCFFPKKRNHYLLPLYPFLALGIAEGIWYYGQRREQWLRWAKVAISLAIIGGPVYFGLILPWHRPAGDPELSFLTAVTNRAAPASLFVCDAGMDEELAWVRRKYQGIETVTNVDHAAKALQAAAKGTDVVARKLFFTALTNAPYRLPLEPIFEQSLGHKGPWYLLRYGD